MKVQGTHYRSVWWEDGEAALRIVDQTVLPHEFRILSLKSMAEVADAIREMRVRGAPLIGATAAFGLALSLLEDPSPENETRAEAALLATRPTAVNLRWALRRVREQIRSAPRSEKASRAMQAARALCDEEVEACRRIGEHGLAVLQDRWDRGHDRQGRLDILTHCNTGWLATVDWGTALSCVYHAHDAGIPVHVWVGETRPRSQGARLTAWELAQHGVPHTVIPDGSSGHLLQRGLVDVCLVGSDRTTASGDVCNKVGTYPIALAARDNDVPFYVALPVSSIDWEIRDGMAEIPIETRDPDEVTHVRGRTAAGGDEVVVITPPDTRAANYAFDVTPARLVTALVTEEGVFPATPDGLARLAARLAPDASSKSGTQREESTP